MLEEVEIIEFPSIEKMLVAFLRKELADTMGWVGVRVSTKVEGGTHVQVIRTGGTTMGLVRENAQVTLDCRAVHDVDAAKLAADCHALVLAAGRAGEMSGQTIYEVDAFATPRNTPDPTTGSARYSATYVVPVRGVTQKRK